MCCWHFRIDRRRRCHGGRSSTRCGGPNWFGDEHIVDVHIRALRRKLGDDAAAPPLRPYGARSRVRDGGHGVNRLGLRGAAADRAVARAARRGGDTHRGRDAGGRPAVPLPPGPRGCGERAGAPAHRGGVRAGRGGRARRRGGRRARGRRDHVRRPDAPHHRAGEPAGRGHGPCRPRPLRRADHPVRRRGLRPARERLRRHGGPSLHHRTLPTPAPRRSRSRTAHPPSRRSRPTSKASKTTYCPPTPPRGR